MHECRTRALILRKYARSSVFENEFDRRILEPKRQKISEGQRKWHNEELNSLYSSLNIIRSMKSRRIRWIGPIAYLREIQNSLQNM
jgi:hypothetical protein